MIVYLLLLQLVKVVFLESAGVDEPFEDTLRVGWLVVLLLLVFLVVGRKVLLSLVHWVHFCHKRLLLSTKIIRVLWDWRVRFLALNQLL